MEQTAGTVKVEIGANLTAFEAALAKGRQMADLFDQQVSKKLGNTGASEAGLSKIAGLIEQTNALLMKMTGTVTTADASMNKFSADATKAAVAVDDVKSSASAAAPAVGKLSSEFNSATSSIQRAVAANQQFSASNRALAAASNLKLADGTAASTAEMEAYAVALDDIRAKYNPLFGAIRQYLSLKDELRIATKLGAISEEEAGAALSKGRQETLAAIGVLKGHTDALKGHGAAAGLGATQMMALTHAVRSFTEQIAMGASPLQALTAQMNHLTYVASGPGGASGAFSAIGNMALGMVTKFARIGAAIGGAAIGFEYLRDQASETEKRTVGFGETAVAIFQVVRDGIRNAFGPALAVVFDPLIYAFKKLGSAAVDIAELVINSFHAAFVDVEMIWQALPASFGLTFAKAANFGIEAMNSLIKKSSDAVDQIITIFNKLGANIPLLSAGAQTIPPIDEKPYMDSLDRLVADRNAKIQQIMNSTPIRDFGQAVIDKIQTNHALEGLNALANVDFGKSIGGANQLGNAIGGISSNASGVTVTIGGMAQQVINVTKAFEDAKRAQLGQLVSAQMNLVQMKQDAIQLQQTLAAAGQRSVSDVFGSFFSDTAGARQAIADAASGIDSIFKQFDAGRETASEVNAEIEKVRATLLAMGGDPNAINAFIDSLVNGQLQARQLKSNVDSLSQSIRAIPNRTVTITVRTQQVGSGTQSLYDVPNGSGGTSQVGVTRYGGTGSSSGPSITSNEVPRTSGYGSMGGGGDLGSTTVNVTRFATGGMIHPGDTQQVSFFKSPDETVGIFTPAQRAALANPGGPSSQVGAEQDSFYTLLQSIETNTKKTAQLLDEIHTAAASSYSGLGGGGSSSGGSSYNQSAYDAAFSRAFDAAGANYQAARMAGGGDGIVPFAQGLVASPFDIAVNAARLATGQGGTPSVGLGAGGATSYERSLAAQSQQMAALSAQNIKAGGLGFATGGMIDAGDTQKVEFFKNPNEKVIIAKPSQFQDMRSQSTEKSSNDNRPINVYLTQNHTWNGNAPPSKDSTAEVRRQTSLGIRDGLRSLNGR